MVMGACPGQIPISCVPLTLMVTATVVRACRYNERVLLARKLIFLVVNFSQKSRNCLTVNHEQLQ